jgi:hypothetical protein
MSHLPCRQRGCGLCMDGGQFNDVEGRKNDGATGLTASWLCAGIRSAEIMKRARIILPMFAARITLPHFSISPAISFRNLLAEKRLWCGVGERGQSFARPRAQPARSPRVLARDPIAWARRRSGDKDNLVERRWSGLEMTLLLPFAILFLLPLAVATILHFANDRIVIGGTRTGQAQDFYHQPFRKRRLSCVSFRRAQCDGAASLLPIAGS